jgi:hypothetical protein
MYYPDLGHRCDVDFGKHVRAVGWLERHHPYPTGSVPPAFFTALNEHVCAAWQPVGMPGIHLCEFCPQPLPNGRFVGGNSNVWIPCGDRVFVAPGLILHYIEAHAYRPPQEFIDAVLAAPEQGSIAFHNSMERFPSWWQRDPSPRLAASF